LATSRAACGGWIAPISAAVVALLAISTATSRADTVAYLVNVTVRPGYNFANAADAIGYGQTLCDKVKDGESFGSMVADVDRDFDTTDEYQGSYLIAQAVNELCPAQIWKLRHSAANYRPGGLP
jgi:hypothetical protein